MPTIDELIVQIDATTEGLRRELKRAESSVDASSRRIEGRVAAMDARFAKLGAGVRTMLAGFGVAGGVAAFAGITTGMARMAEAATNMRARLSLIIGPLGDMESTLDGIARAADQSRGSLEGTVDLYTRLGRATQEMGVSQDRLLAITTTVNQAIRISGAEASAAQAALVQLGQGLASGALRGEELNSVMEQTPRLAQALADGLGVGIGKLREMGKAGELTAATVIRALESQSLAVQREFGRMPMTVGDAMQQVRNELFESVMAMNDASGASAGLAGFISNLARGISRAREIIEAMSGAVSDLSAGFDAGINPARRWLQEFIDAVPGLREVDDLLRRLALHMPTNVLLSAGREGDSLERELRGEEYRRLAQAGNFVRPSAIVPSVGAVSDGGGASARSAAAASRLEEVRAIARQQDAIEQFIDSLDQEIAALANRETTWGRSEGVIARVNAEQELSNLLSRENVTLTDEQRAAIDTYMNHLERATDRVDALEQAEQKKAESAKRALREMEQQAERVQRLGEDIGNSISSSFEDAILSGRGLSDVLGGIAQDIERILLRAAVTQPLAQFLTRLVSAGAGIAFGGGTPDAFSFPDGTRASTFAAGGFVSGPGGPRDDRVPALLSDGEYVVNASAVDRYRPLLDAINSNRIVKMARGGMISAMSPAMPQLPRLAGASGGGVQVNIMNRASSDVEVKASKPRKTQSGEAMEIVIDRAVSRALQTPGSLSDRAMRDRFGLNSTTARR